MAFSRILSGRWKVKDAMTTGDDIYRELWFHTSLEASSHFRSQHYMAAKNKNSCILNIHTSASMIPFSCPIDLARWLSGDEEPCAQQDLKKITKSVWFESLIQLHVLNGHTIVSEWNWLLKYDTALISTKAREKIFFIFLLPFHTTSQILFLPFLFFFFFFEWQLFHTNIHC